MSEYDRLKAQKDAILARQKEPTNFEKVGQFNDACGCHREPKPGLPPKEVIRMRIALIQEELDELSDACYGSDEGDAEQLTDIADALADLEYVVHGAAHTFGINSQPIFDEVHRSNMAKVGADGKVTRREDGKILKPEGWTPPQILPLIERQLDGPTCCYEHASSGGECGSLTK